MVGSAEGAAGDHVARARIKALRVDAVVDLGDRLVRHANMVLKILGEVLRQRDIVVHERPIQPAHQPVAAAASFGVLDVPTMLAMDPHRDAGGPCRHDRLQRRQVAGMHDRRAQRLEQAQQLRVIARQVSRTLAQRDVVHVRMGDSLGELAGDIGERHDCVAPALARKVIDQVDDPVLEPAHAEAEDDVRK